MFMENMAHFISGITRPLRRLTALVAGAGLLLHTLHAQEKAPPGGVDCLAASAAPQINLRPALGKAEKITAPDGPVREYWRYEIRTMPVNSWDVQHGVNVSAPVKLGDKCLLAFYCRAAPGLDADGKVTGMASVEDRAAGYHKIGQTEFKAGAEWEWIVHAFTADAALTDGKGAISIHLGREVQSLDIGGVQLLNYGPDMDLAKLPRRKVTYEGREADAPWRKAALERIEKTRKSPLTITVLDAAGKPVSGADVHLRLQRHEFGFGTAVTAQWMADTSPDGEKYRAIVDECFSRVVFENDLKNFALDLMRRPVQEGGFQRQYLDKAMDWLAQRQFSVRGHYLCWAPYEEWSEKLKSTPDAIRSRIYAHMDEALAMTGDRVTEWDVVNHPAAWEPGICIDTVLGAGIYGEVINRARSKTKLPLWINEDQVFRPGRQQEEYYRIIKQIIDSGTKLDGIGNQAHMHASFLPSPEEVLTNSERFAALVPALQITEFDVQTNGDDQLAADYTRDLLITCFSHPAYTGFVLWGFWEGRHWKPEAAPWRMDWSEKPVASTWREWVTRKWRTDEHLTTSTSGSASTRGFHGHYKVEVRHQGRVAAGSITLNNSRPGQLTLTLP